MCYVDWMKEDWEVQICEGATDLQTQDHLKFVDGPAGKQIVYQANSLPWAEGISYSHNDDIVMGTRNGCPFQITRSVPLNGDPAQLSCTISGGTSGDSSALVGGGSASFFSALLALFGKQPGFPRRRRSRVHYPGGGSDNGGGSWTALEGGVT
jgi:hypothetical protein